MLYSGIAIHLFTIKNRARNRPDYFTDAGSGNILKKIRLEKLYAGRSVEQGFKLVWPYSFVTTYKKEIKFILYILTLTKNRGNKTRRL